MSRPNTGILGLGPFQESCLIAGVTVEHLLDSRRTRSQASKLPSVMGQKALRAVFA